MQLIVTHLITIMINLIFICLKLINFKEFGFNLQRLLNPQCFNLSFPQRIWAWVDKKKKEHVHSN